MMIQDFVLQEQEIWELWLLIHRGCFLSMGISKLSQDLLNGLRAMQKKVFIIGRQPLRMVPWIRKHGVLFYAANKIMKLLMVMMKCLEDGVAKTTIFTQDSHFQR
jgi:hypothetical protein